MNAILDLSVDSRFARAGVPAANNRLDDVVGYLNVLIRRHVGRHAFRRGRRTGDIYYARFTSEDAARIAMAWIEDTLSDVRITTWRSGVTLTGVIDGGRL